MVIYSLENDALDQTATLAFYRSFYVLIIYDWDAYSASIAAYKIKNLQLKVDIGPILQKLVRIGREIASLIIFFLANRLALRIILERHLSTFEGGS